MLEITSPGAPRWYGLIVPPQKEGAAEQWLSLRGVYAFHPVKSHVVAIRGKRIRRESRYLPGYVFARFDGAIIWHRVQASPFISDAIRVSTGQPATLNPDDLKGIYSMRHRDEAEAEAERQSRTIRAGDRARILSGVFEGQEVEVCEIRAGGAVLRVQMFGGEVAATIPLASMRKIA
jgi:transcription antitermination factor NusG